MNVILNADAVVLDSSSKFIEEVWFFKADFKRKFSGGLFEQVKDHYHERKIRFYALTSIS